MNTHKIAVVLVLISFPTVGYTQVAPQKINPSCQTEATGGNGVRDSCNSSWSEVTAPEGYVIVPQTIERKTNFNGSNNRCEEEFSEYKDIAPGIPMPTKLRVRAHAYSAEGMFGGAGHTNCDYTVNFAKAP